MLRCSSPHSNRIRTIGSLLLLFCGLVYAGNASSEVRYSFPFKAKKFKVAVSMAISASTDRVYYWYHDGTMSVGTSRNPTQHQSYKPSGQPKGKFLIAAAISRSDRVYYWYDDGTVSQGTSTDPDRYNGYRKFNLDASKPISGAAIAKSSDRTYYWYEDGTRSVGTTTNLTQHSGGGYLSPALGADARNLLGVGIAKNDHVYYWYDDGTVSSGTTTDLSKYVFYKPYLWKPKLGTLAAYWHRKDHGAGVQKHGFDFGTRRFQSEYRVAEVFNGDTTLLPGEHVDTRSENRDYMIYGQRIFAIADGEIIACWRNAPENTTSNLHPKVTQGLVYGGGNGFWIRHADGSRAEYAHMIPGTPPKALCPNERRFLPEPDGPRVEDSWPHIRVPNARRIKVRAGDYLGRVGNSGTSSHPHLHLHVEKGGRNPRAVNRKKPEPIRFGAHKSLQLGVEGARWFNTRIGTLPPGPVLIRPYPDD